MPFKSSMQPTDRGPIQMVVDDITGRRVSVFNRPFPAGSPLAIKGAVLYSACGDYGLTLNTAASTLLPEVIHTHSRVAAQNIVRAPLIAFMGDGQAEAQTVAKATAVALSVPAATVANRPVRDRAVKAWDAMDIVGRSKAIVEWPLEKLSGLMEISAFDEMPPDLAEVARERYMRLRHIASTGLSADFPKTPTAQDPLCIGVDQEAVEAAAQVAVDRLKARVEDVNNAAAVLRDVTMMVAVTCEITIDASFALLTNTQQA